jgi:hypothetical protein
MASTFLRPTVIARAAVDLLLRELVLARTVWSDAVSPAEFEGAFGDTVTLRIPAKRTARTRVLRAGSTITNDDSHEFGVPVVLDTDVYNGAPITDEDLTLSIQDFGRQILMPQIRAVAEGVEDQVAALLTGATYETDHTIDADSFQTSSVNDWYKIANRARRILNESHVPMGDRYMVVGTAIEEEILNNDKFIRNDSIGNSSESALREATIGRIAGFTVIPSTSIPDTDAYAYHRTAFVLAARAPRVPQGANMAVSRSLGEAERLGAASGLSGIGVRWLMDYDYSNTTDRSLVNTWVGTAVVEDPDDPSSSSSSTSLVRAVRVSGGGASS